MVIFFSSHFFQRYNNGFGIYDKEETFPNSNEKKTFSESSLKREEAIQWTKGEILGKGAYGTVSSSGTLKSEFSTSSQPLSSLTTSPHAAPATLFLRTLSAGITETPTQTGLRGKIFIVLCN
jgi:hypothetical protein